MTDGMRLLALDIETSPALVYTWSLFKPMIGIEQVVEPTRMICFTARWYGEDETMFYSEFHHGREKMVRKIRTLLDQADAVMHFNGKSFDIPHIKREILEAGLTPPSPFKQIDLMLTAKSQFRFLSNKLQWISTRLGTEGKVKHSGFALWRRCLDGDRAAWAEMRKYAVQDTDLLIELYEILKPWIVSPPNQNLYIDSTKPVCPACGKGALQSRGVQPLIAGGYRRYWCNPSKGGCGAWSRGNIRITSSERTAVRA